MLRSSIRGRVPGAGVATLAMLALSGCGDLAQPRPDPLAAEIGRWSEFLRADTSSRELMSQVKPGARAQLDRAQDALRRGWRLLALQRLGEAHANLSAALYERDLGAAARKDVAGFEAEWARMGTVLRPELGDPAANAFDGVRPAAVRALGEATLPQVRVYYDASLEYGRNTVPVNGLLYLGVARAQRDFAALCRELSARTPGRAPALRGLAGELDSLETELLAAYRPPASIDRHAEFIAISAALKEARELDAARLRHGAMLRYLQASLRLARLRAATPPDTSGLANRLWALEARLSSGRADHSIARLFLETARAAPDTARDIAATIVAEVIPRYYAALEPAPPAEPASVPQVTVTLVRWPYT